MSFGIVLFIVAILTVVMIHEAGHFLVARAFDFKTTKFFVGFGPTLWSTHRGETEYGVKALPLGGFVKIVGMNPYEEVPEEDRSRSYPNKPRWQRALVLVAGSATHWVVAFALLLAGGAIIGDPTGEATTTVAQVTSTLEGTTTPAGETDLEPGDRITALDGTEVSSWEEVSSYIKSHPEDEIELTIVRDGTERTVTTTVGTAVFDDSGSVVAYAPPGESLRPTREGETTGGFFGISPEPEYRRLGLGDALGAAGSRTWQATYLSVTNIGGVLAIPFKASFWEALSGEGERTAGDGPVGLVGMSRVAGETIAAGQWLSFIDFIVLLVVFLGVMNLLPLPPLDGGHLAVLAWEKATGKAVDVRKLIPLAAVVIAFFLMLFFAVLYLDLARPLAVPF